MNRDLIRRPGPRDELDFQTQFLQRWAPLIAGGLLAAYGVRRRSKAGAVFAAAGAAFAYQGVKAGNERQQHFARSSVVVNASRDEVFRFWRNFENLPRFMHHLESVNELGNGRSEWTAIGPAGKRITWTAEILAERENEYISWRSQPGSIVQVDGIVEFRDATGKRGTLVDAMVEYRTAGGPIGNVITKLLGKDPSWLMRQDLRRFKSLLETGEIPTVEGQPHGPRSAVAAASRLIDPDRPLSRNASFAQAANARRRVS